MPRLTLVTLNVRGLDNEKGFARLLQMIQRRKRKQNIGAFCIQEHNLKPDAENSIKLKGKIAGFTVISSFGRTTGRGHLTRPFKA